MPGQIHIQQDEIQPGVPAPLDALLSGLGPAEFEPFLRERLAEQIGHLAIIVDDQYFPHSTSIRPMRVVCQFRGWCRSAGIVIFDCRHHDQERFRLRAQFGTRGLKM
jgi:hypothetical protein